jgi:hypothetical protein
LILPLSARPEDLLSCGKSYPWPRPVRCPRCGSSRLWGHGYVERYFDPLVMPVFVKRYRCPDCRAVHTYRPRAHWRRFLAPILLILESICGKLEGRQYRMPPGRTRQQYWVQGYRIQSHYGGLPPTSVAELLSERIILATHSLTDRAFLPGIDPPYRRLASTPCIRGHRIPP